MKSRPLVIAIDIGGTTVKAGYVDREGKVAAVRTASSPSANRAAFRRGLDSLLDLLFRETPAGSRPGAAGIGCKGIIEPDTSRVKILPGHFRFLEGVRLDSWVRARRWPGIPVRSDNDAKAALAGEMRWGAAKGKRNVVLLTLGSGVGGAILADGRLLRGSEEIAGHLGHTTVDFEGPLCSCGNRGCLEAVFSARAIEGEALAALRRGCETRLGGQSWEDGSRITCLDVFSAAAAGDKVAGAVVRRAVAALAGGMAGIAHALDPEIFVLGGQIAEAGSALFDPLRKDFHARTRRLAGRRIPIRPAVFRELAGLTGAAALAWNALDGLS